MSEISAFNPYLKNDDFLQLLLIIFNKLSP